MDSERDLTAAELQALHRKSLLVSPEEVDDEHFPRLFNVSAGFMAQAVIRPESAEPPEYVTLKLPGGLAESRYVVAVSEWNSMWEAAQFRRRFFDLDDLPPRLARIADAGDVNVIVVPRTRSRYYEYAPLLHLLPARTRHRFGLPLVKSGQWPFTVEFGDIDRLVPSDLERRLSRAWAWQVWPHLISGSGLGAFSETDPVRVLAHNLDFWLPAVTAAIQDELRSFPEVDKGVVPGPVPLDDGSVLPGARTGNPRMGGDVWRGADEAAAFVSRTVEAADATGRLRGIIDAVRSNRIEDDFSPAWSWARADFERKLHKTRAKVRVRFVELTDTIPVQGPESQVVGDLVTNDFMALLDPRQRQIVVLLNSGVTRHAEIAALLGYANHSPVTKRLADIRRRAAAFFDEIDR